MTTRRAYRRDLAVWKGPVLNRIAAFPHLYPALAALLAIGLGYLIGGVKIRGFCFGSVTGSLVGGLANGWPAAVPIAPVLTRVPSSFGVPLGVGSPVLQMVNAPGSAGLAWRMLTEERPDSATGGMNW
jgi:hypothetical protein